MTEPGGTRGEETSGMDQAKEKAREVKAKTKATAESVADDARDLGHEAVAEGKEKARELGDEAGRRARSKAEQQKARVSDGMRTMADALRHGTADLPEERRQFGGFIETVADRVEGASRYLDNHEVDDLTRDARRVARDHTALVLGGAFALGLAGARFLKSSGSEAARGGGDRYEPRAVGPGRGMSEPARTEEWHPYNREPVSPYPRSSTPRQATERIQEEGGYA